MHDVRFAVRNMLRHPGLTAATTLTLAIGIGATTAMFAVTHAVLLRPLPYADPDRLVRIWHEDGPDADDHRVSPAAALAWRADTSLFDAVAYWAAYQDASNFTLVGPEGSQAVRGAFISGNLFSTLGVVAAHGRALRQDDDEPVRQAVAVISHGLWQRRFGGAADVVGQTLTIDSYWRRDFTVVGVMPSGFGFPDETAVWVPAGWSDLDMTRAGVPWLMVVGRLGAGVSPDAAQRRLSTRPVDGVADRSPPRVIGLGDALTGDVRAGILVLQGAAALVLLVACVNVANLRLAHTRTRRPELAVRQVLGAGTGRLMRQLLVEQAAVGLLGGVGGILLAAAGLAFLPDLAPAGAPRLAAAGVGAPVLLVTACVSLGASLMIGLAPALWLRRDTLAPGLRDAARGTVGSRGASRLQDGLLLAEVAVTVTLVVGAGLLLRSLARLEAVDVGFDPDGLVTTSVDMTSTRYSSSAGPGPNRPQAFTELLLARIAALPGVDHAAATERLPPGAASSVRSVGIMSTGDTPSVLRPAVVARAVTADYFRTMGIPLLRGRSFRPTDTEATAPVAIINETLARRAFPDGDPIGRGLIDVAGSRPGVAPVVDQIIGVVADVRNDGIERPVQPEVYKHSYQWAWRRMSLVVRSDLEPRALSTALRGAVSELDPNQPVADVRPMDGVLGPAYAEARFRTRLTGGFGLVALTLAAVGIFGVLDYRVRRRIPEIGLRLALGATPAEATRAVVGPSAMLIVGGVGLGVATAAALGVAMRSVLFEVSPFDPAAFGSAVTLVGGVAVAAAAGAARRATRVDPATALRSD